MFTLKHVESNGYESIRPATCLSYDPTQNALYAYGTGVAIGNVTPTDATPIEGGGVCFGNGIVYVMNDAGQTVSKYDLDHLAKCGQANTARK